MLRGGNEILKTVQEHLGGLHVGDTTKDGKFTVVEVECLGACSNAPMLAVNDDFYVCHATFILFYSHLISPLGRLDGRDDQKNPGRFQERYET